MLADALTHVTGVPEPYEGYPEGLLAVQLPDPKVPSYLLDTFGRPERVTPCACERAGEVTMPQVLHLLNSESLSGRISAGDGRLGRLLDRRPSARPRDCRQALFLSSSSAAGRPTRSGGPFPRRPGRAPAADRAAVFRDLTWALVNSREFLFGH